jgi:hypothetical protein
LVNHNQTIEAIIELYQPNSETPCPILSDPNLTFIRLYLGMSDEEIGSVIITACLYNRIDIFPSLTETLNAFLSLDSFILPGGLQFSEDGKVKVSPGCCCGIEDWREWLDVAHGKNSVWAGHDPSPWVEYIDDSVRIWQDERGKESSFVEIRIEEMTNQLRRIESDLRGFMVRPGKWTSYYAQNLESKIVEHFIKNMDIR